MICVIERPENRIDSNKRRINCRLLDYPLLSRESQIYRSSSSFPRTNAMTSLTQGHLRAMLKFSHVLKISRQARRAAVTVTDEYRSLTKSRSSLKGVDLLRNPALNKVSRVSVKSDPERHVSISIREWPFHWKRGSIWAFMDCYHRLYFPKISKR